MPRELGSNLGVFYSVLQSFGNGVDFPTSCAPLSHTPNEGTPCQVWKLLHVVSLSMQEARLDAACVHTLQHITHLQP
jgi:hypothetical protein